MSFRNLHSLTLKTLAFFIAGFLFCQCSTNEINKPSSSSISWTHYGGSPEQCRYVEVNGITRDNVDQMEISWSYFTEDERNYFFSPIIVDTTMYVLGKNNSLIALDINDGKEIWIHANLDGITRRGINYWESNDKSDKPGICNRESIPSIKQVETVT